MTSYKTDRTVGPWALEKLDCLDKYLSAYTTILRKKSWCTDYFFFDAFAGAGRAPLRQTTDTLSSLSLLEEVSAEMRLDDDAADYVNGSPYVALGIRFPFTQYFFVELDSEKIKRLERDLLRFRTTRNFKIIPADAGTAIQKEILQKNIDWRRTRGLIFLDPFGLQVPWRILESIARTRAIEVIINLPIGTTIQRLLPKNSNISQERRIQLNEYFGSNEWEAVVYKTDEDLFGEHLTKHDDSGSRLARWYRDRLKNLFGNASRARLIKNHKGGHLYYLIWAGPHPVGQKIADEILGRGSEAI